MDSNQTEQSAQTGSVWYEGLSVSGVPLRDGLTIGNDRNCDYRVHDPSVGEQRRAYCVTVRGDDDGFRLVASGYDERGVLINASLFSDRDLIIGDYLQLGPSYFRFDGAGMLHAVVSAVGGVLEADGIHFSYSKGSEKVEILKGAHMQVPAGHFVGIIGPSGAGKTTFLKVVSGIHGGGDGSVLIDGRPLPKEEADRRELIGYVPQDDIVHYELTVWQALSYGAQLRLPKGIPDYEIRQLICRVLGRLFFGYTERDFETSDQAEKAKLEDNIETLLKKRVGDLSGGQRKRVSVAVELMSRPRLLFLDEPTSGLDPAAETELMSMLRDITSSGCSVVCTTHVLENLWRMHSFVIVCQGNTVFQGSAEAARSYFSVDHLSGIYSKLEQQPEFWIEKGKEAPASERVKAPEKRSNLSKSKGAGVLRQLSILLRRQWALLCSDVSNFWLLLGQPLLIGLILNLVSSTDQAIPHKLFFSMVVVFWFGCSNAALQIVREKAILRRELAVGLGLFPYLAGKCVFFCFLTIIQAALLWGVLAIPWYSGVGMFLETSPAKVVVVSFFWQALALVAMGLCSTAVGLCLSSWAKRSSQASFFVPLIVIPQILFAGFVFPLSDWQERDEDGWRERAGKAVVRNVAGLVPSSGGERMMETSLVWDQSFDSSEPTKRNALNNLKVASGSDDWESFKKDETYYRRPAPAMIGLSLLGVWTILSLFLSWGLLRSRR